MQTLPKPSGPSGFHAFLHIAQRGVHLITGGATDFRHLRRRADDRLVCVTKSPTSPATPSGKGAYPRKSNTLNSRILRHNSPTPALPPSRGRLGRLPRFEPTFPPNPNQPQPLTTPSHEAACARPPLAAIVREDNPRIMESPVLSREEELYWLALKLVPGLG